MITQTKAQQLIDLALSHAGRRVQGAEVTVSSSDVATSRFAGNSMTQNQAPDRTEIAVRLIKNGRQLRQSSDNLQPAAIRRLVDDAIAALDYLQPDKSILALPGKLRRAQAGVKRYDKRTATLSAADRAEAVNQIVDIAGELSAAGVVASGSTLLSIGNSRGLFSCHTESLAECSITMSAGADTGWSKASQVRFADLDVAELAASAAAKARANNNPVEVPPGRYTVILEPAAVIDLLWFLAYDFAATSHIDKQSCFGGKLGEKVLGDNITILDDPYHPLGSGAPFDGEGQPRQRVTLVDQGKIAGMVVGRKAAATLSIDATGHGLPEPNAEGEMPMNLVVAGGNTSLEQMIAATSSGIVLTRVWYVRDVDPITKIVTGMTRDGTFLVENGKLAGAVKNLRFNQGLLEMLRNVTHLGPAVRTCGEEAPVAAVVPAMLVDGFNFASTTTF